MGEIQKYEKMGEQQVITLDSDWNDPPKEYRVNALPGTADPVFEGTREACMAYIEREYPDAHVTDETGHDWAIRPEAADIANHNIKARGGREDG